MFYFYMTSFATSSKDGSVTNVCRAFAIGANTQSDFFAIYAKKRGRPIAMERPLFLTERFIHFIAIFDSHNFLRPYIRWASPDWFLFQFYWRWYLPLLFESVVTSHLHPLDTVG